jgi:hypothetical protein
VDRSITPAQITFVLKEHLKNAQIACIGAAALLGLQRTSLYARGKGHDTLRALTASLAVLRRRAAAFETLPPGLRADRDFTLLRLNSACGVLARAMRFADPRGIRLSAIGRKSPPRRTHEEDRRGSRRAG